MDDLSLILELNPAHKRALVDLKRVGGSMSVRNFDEVNKPHGELLRRDLTEARLIFERSGMLFVTARAMTVCN